MADGSLLKLVVVAGTDPFVVKVGRCREVVCAYVFAACHHQDAPAELVVVVFGIVYALVSCHSQLLAAAPSVQTREHYPARRICCQ